MLKLACVTLLVEGALSLLPAPRAVPQHRRVALRAGDSEWEAEVKQASGAFLEEESKNWLKQMSSGIDSEMRTANNALIDWLSDNGVWVSDQSGWDQPPHALALSSATVDEAEGEASGRGLLMRRAVAEAQPLFTLPFKLCMLKTTARAILGEARVPDDMNEYLAIAQLLIHERSLGDRSFWAPYMGVLPTTEEVGPTFVWPESEFAMLEGSPVVNATLSMRAKLRAEHEAVLASAAARGAPLDPDVFTYEAWEWAFTMLFSRAIRLRSATGGETLAMVPYADLINHSPYSAAYVDARKGERPLPWAEREDDDVILYADRAYKKFEQLYISYGQKSNAELLLLYGFALDRNPFNSVALSVGVSSDDPLYEAKAQFASLAGRTAAATAFPLFLDRFPDELFQFLRMACATEKDLVAAAAVNAARTGVRPASSSARALLSDADYSRRLSNDNEIEVLTTIATACDAALDRYPTSEEEDTKLIDDRTMFNMLSRNQRMAIRLRRTEKRLLKKTIETTGRRLAEIDGPVAAKPAEDFNRVVTFPGLKGGVEML